MGRGEKTGRSAGALPTETQKKTALVISGGGSKGAFAVGMIRDIYSRFRSSGWFGIIGGSSTGALITPLAGLMGGPESLAREALETMVHEYSTVNTRDIIERKPVVQLTRSAACLSLSGPLRRRVERFFTEERFQWLHGSEAPYCYVVYTNFQSGDRVVVSPKDPGMTRERFIDAMMASASVPVLMEATLIDGDICYDGGLRDVLPFDRAVSLGAETIVPLFLDPEKLDSSKSSFRRLDTVMVRALFIMLDEIIRTDLEAARLVNIAVRARDEIMDACRGRPLLRRRFQRLFSRDVYAELFGSDKNLVRIIEGLRPDEQLIEDPLRFEPARMRRWIELGEKKCRQVLTESPFTGTQGALRRR